MADAIKVRCPQCGELLRISKASLDQKIQCRTCSKSFRAAPKAAPPVVPTQPSPPPPRTESAVAAAEPNFNFDNFQNLGTASLISQNFRPASRSTRGLVIGLLVMGVTAAAAVGLYGSGWLRGSPSAPSSAGHLTIEKPSKTKPEQNENQPIVSRVHFPRRLLFIGIHQYAYANPLSPTPTELLFPSTIREFAERKLRIDKDQMAILSDLAAEKGAQPPSKPIITQMVEQFLGASRPQDRLMLVFVGHALDVNDQPYLVPIEGELGALESLIPLQWVYDRLAACPARQKLFIIDTCRLDAARGLERPGSGPMGPKLDAALANPPPGVQVWSACTANQYSYEFEEANTKTAVVRGGVFLSLMTQAFAQGGNVQKPEDGWPLEFLEKQVSGPVQELVREREVGAVQTPRLAGAEPVNGAAYNPDEPRPPRFELPPTVAQGGRADPKEIERLLMEVAVPPLKLPRELKNEEPPSRQAATLAATFPFSASTMAAYAADYQNLREIFDKPKEFPLRFAVLQTVESLDRQGRLNRVKVGDKEVAADRLIETVRDAGTDDKVKKSLTKSQQDGPALMLVELQEMLELMEKAGRNRDREPSKRWQAHYDYVLAMLKMRMVYVNEYNAMIAKVKRDELPKLDPKLHNGWRLAAQDKITSPKEVKDLASDARKLLAKLIQEHPGTPWEVLAKRDRSAALGLSWQPTKLGK
jgi:hypothetical protein